MNISIIGHGFVGKATEQGFSNDVNKILLIDPKLNTSHKDLINFKSDFIFICLPTPMDDDGKQDFSIVLSVLKKIRKLKLKSTLVMKSTVTPDNILKALKIFPNLIYNPEFLREKYAEHDFINPEMIILGGKRKEQKKLENLYLNFSNCSKFNFIHTDILTASLIKYSINCFLASKVLFFNQLKEIFDCSQANESWENFIDYLSNDSRMGNSHMMVPGSDGKKGYGGACFPKDTVAFFNYSKLVGREFSLLETTIKTNNKIRSKYKFLEKREEEQNIKFN